MEVMFTDLEKGGAEKEVKKEVARTRAAGGGASLTLTRSRRVRDELELFVGSS